MNPRPYTTDTAADAREVQLDCLRRIPPRQRLQKAISLSSQLRKMAFDAIRRRCPELDEREVQLKFIRLTYGAALAADFERWSAEHHLE